VMRGWWDASILDEFEAAVRRHMPAAPAGSGDQ
jgi:hypothetical protein